HKELLAAAEKRIQEAEERAQEAIAAAEEKALQATRLAKLSQKVTKPERVLKLMDDPSEFFDADGNLDEKKLLKEFPEYALNTATVPDIRPAGRVGASIEEQIRRQARR